METNDFTYTIKFSKCDNCPFNIHVDDDYSPTHNECERTGDYIMKWSFREKIDYRNPLTDVLNTCPFLKKNTIVDDNR